MGRSKDHVRNTTKSNLPRVECAILVASVLSFRPFSACLLLHEVRQSTLADHNLLSVLCTCASVVLHDHSGSCKARQKLGAP